MFDVFRGSFRRDNATRSEAGQSVQAPSALGLEEFLEEFGGGSFEEGLYRIARTNELDEWQRRVVLAFPEFAENTICFGFDWLGTIFALDLGREVLGAPGVLMFEPGTGEALKIPSNLASFHNEGLFEFQDAALASNFYAEWRSKGGSAPAYNECIGYKKPLFLGGHDEVGNLETCDIDVYWHIMGQLIAKVRGLPRGTPINKISIE